MENAVIYCTRPTIAIDGLEIRFTEGIGFAEAWSTEGYITALARSATRRSSYQGFSTDGVRSHRRLAIRLAASESRLRLEFVFLFHDVFINMKQLEFTTLYKRTAITSTYKRSVSLIRLIPFDWP